jgi:release factor glutamine methyltransferase
LRTGHWVDLGTGSGAIALGLARALPQAAIHAVDVSPSALTVAQQNAANLGLQAQIHFYHGNWFEPIAHLQGQLAGMVSNPPYIPTHMLSTLQPEVIGHEPLAALDGGADGLMSIRHLVRVAPDFLRPGGIWLIELMAGQAQAVVELLRHQGCYRDIRVEPDLAGIERFAIARLQT